MSLLGIHSLWTVLAFLTFLGIVVWAWSGHRKKLFDEAAQLPFSSSETMAQRDEDNELSGERRHD